MAASFIDNIDNYGSLKFKGAIAAPYLKAQGLNENLLEDMQWPKTHADEVAKAVVAWAKNNGASLATHWFQPLGSSGMRLGQTGQVHNAMFNFGSNGKPNWVFDGGDLLKGETDGSSYMNGGLRATHTAGGYTALDPSSPIFIQGDTVCIPTVFVSFHGDALDEKTPLLRAMQAVSKEGVRLLKLLGYKVGGVVPNIGLEQEFFLVPRDAYYKRPDLQFAGRTIMGASAARGQELCDHYMAPLNQVAKAAMAEIQHECFKMGIPLKTRHREVAPNQYECAPFFGIASAQIDENLVVMQVIEEVAAKHGLAAILHEKPFKGINGSGKHNNFSLGTDTGINLFNAKQVAKASGNPETFPVLMAAVVSAVDKHGDLMRMAISSPGNDFRLGACEAPPAIISTYLGESLTSYLEEFKKGKEVKPYEPANKTVDLGLDNVAPFTVPAEDRNRTSPFPYGGHRFEFRAVGSTQNVSVVNTVLCTAIAAEFKSLSDSIEAGTSAKAAASKLLDEHWKVIFNGNGYSPTWPEEAGKRGIWRIDSGVEAMAALGSEKNVKLFESMKVLSPAETHARVDVMLEQYTGVVEIEAEAMISMINTHVIPSVKKAGLSTDKLEPCEEKITKALDGIKAAGEALEKARLARVLRLETMEEVRAICDECETKVPAELWSLATYKELLFLDSHQGKAC